MIQQTAVQRAQNEKDNQTEHESDVQTSIQLKPDRDPSSDFIRPNAVIQAKLNIGKPNDKYEVEADQMADKVVSTSTSTSEKETSTPTPSIQKKDAAGAIEGEGVKEEEVVETDIQQKSEKQQDLPQDESTVQQKPLSDSITPVVQLKPYNDSIENIQKMGDSEKENEVQMMSEKEGENPIQKMDAENEEEDVQASDIGTESDLQTKLDASTQMDSDVQLMPEPTEEKIQTKCDTCGSSEEKLNIQKKCADCEDKEIQKMESDQEEVQKMSDKEEESPIQKQAEPEEGKVQQKSTNEGSSTGVESTLSASKGKGAPMDGNTQGSMESGFGSDFSGVRIHTDSSAVQMNKDLGAKAFTNGSDIYFNEGQYNPSSKDGQHLLAHELTHTVQQGAVGSSPIQKKNTDEEEPQIQAKLDQFEKPEHGKNSERRLNAELNDRNGGAPPEPSDEPPSRSERRSEMNELEGPTKPRIDEAAIQAPKIDERKKESEEKIDNPEELVENETPAEQEQPQEGQPSIESMIEQYKQNQIQANTDKHSVPNPREPKEVEAPEPLDMTDADGKAIAPDQEGDMAYATALAQISEIRMQGYLTKNKGTNFKKEGLTMQEKLSNLQGTVSKGEKTIGELNDAIKVRKETVEEGNRGLEASKEKQLKFEQESPRYKEEIDTARTDSDDAVSKGEQSKSDNNSMTPEDSEDRANSDEASGEMDSMNSKTTSIDNTFERTQSSFDSTIEKNVIAGQKNLESATKLTETTQNLDQADAHITSLNQTNETAKNEIEAKATEPQQMQTQADRMIEGGDKVINQSFKMEKRLQSIEKKYQGSLKGIKKEEGDQDQDQTAQTSLIQRTPDGDYSDTNQFNVLGNHNLADYNIPNLIANSVTDRRQQEIDRVQEVRRSEISSLTSDAQEPIGELSSWSRVGLGLKLLGGRFLSWASSITMLDMSLFAINMINPITYLLGIGAGLGLVINGAVNLFKNIFIEPSFFGAIKSGGDLATGIAVIAGSITGLALLISLGITAAMFFGFGLAFAPWLPILAQIMSTAGTIAYWSGAAALSLNVIAGMKSLYDLATAETAQELQGEVDDLQQDSLNTLTSLLMIFVGRAGRSGTAPNGGGGGGSKLPVTPGQGSVLLGQFGTTLGERIAAFVGMRPAVPAGVPSGMSLFVPETAPAITPVLRPGISSGTTTTTATNAAVTPSPGNMASTVPLAGTATQTATQTTNNQNSGKLYKWKPNINYVHNPGRPGKFDFTKTVPGVVKYSPQAHHSWPKVMGGDPGQRLWTIAEHIHQNEIHFGHTTSGSPVTASHGSVYRYVTNYLNRSSTWGPAGLNILQNRPIMHTKSSGSSNQLLIDAMGTGTNQASRLTGAVRNALTEYYGFYSAESHPRVPYRQYRDGIDDSYNYIV